MGRIGYTDLPLHTGKAPRWLFDRMVKLSREIIYLIVLEYGKEEFLKKISDPFWFQAFGAVLGFDWHSSGITTTSLGAIKEALKPIEKEIGIFVAGGKGKNAIRTPKEIINKEKYLNVNPDKLIYASKIVAKVDSSALQDGYNLYHHSIIFTDKGNWTIIQQGMNEINKYARRYHWLSFDIKNFIIEPHHAICCDEKKTVLNMTAKSSELSRKTTTLLACEKPEKLIKEINKIKYLKLPDHHHVSINDINPDRLYKIYLKTYEKKPKNFEELLSLKGVGPKSIRALALIAELVYGDSPSYEDPVRFSFTHGGKDGYPYPVNPEIYDNSIETLHNIVNKIKIDFSEKKKALYRLYKFYKK